MMVTNQTEMANLFMVVNEMRGHLEENASKPRIMVVEDEIIVAMDLKQRLESLGYEVVAHALNAIEALASATSKDPDIVLMDIKINGALDGIETATRIRASKDIPIIYLTAFADETTIQRASKTSAYGYLIKPFGDRELRSCIEMAIYKYKAEKRLRESEERYALAALATNDGIWDWDLVTNQIYYSPRWLEMMGFNSGFASTSADEWFDRVHQSDLDHLNQALNAHLFGSKPVFECEYRIRHADGSYRWMSCRGLALFDDQKRPYRIAGSQADITDRKRFEQDLTHKALHDELTGLHNRAAFSDRLEIILQKKKRAPNGKSAVLFLDLDHFKLINDSYGHGWGDQVLIQIANRLENCVRPGDIVARFGGDEFAVLLDPVNELQPVTDIAQRILNYISLPIQVQENEILITASIGILLIDSSYESTDSILRDVDAAMYTAKGKGRGCYQVFQLKVREKAIIQLENVNGLHRALEKNEFFLLYQPIFSVVNLKVVGYEALLHWQHPDRGQIPLTSFLQIAEDSSLIIPIGDWVLRTACAQAKIWNLTSKKPIKITVNICRSQLLADDFPQKVFRILNETGLASNLLDLDISEMTIRDNLDQIMKTIEQLHLMGVGLGIDDFESNLTSLKYLKRIYAHSIKIGRPFIHDLDEDGQLFIQSIIQTAHQLRFKTIAEGIEDETQLTVLSGMGCDEVQGNYLGMPIQPESVLESIG